MKKIKRFKELYVLMLDGHILTADTFRQYWKNYGTNELYGWKIPKKIYYTLGIARAGLRWVPAEIRPKVEIHKFVSIGKIES